jgi:hypothetical protein
MRGSQLGTQFSIADFEIWGDYRYGKGNQGVGFAGGLEGEKTGEGFIGWEKWVW